ncbi:MAG: hypothetical protein ACT4O1_06295 [Gemmatimonadota bacterium]
MSDQISKAATSATGAVRPEFVDNLDGNTMAAGLRGHINFVTAAFKDPRTSRLPV